jgi:hypothetical protein
MIKYHKHNHTLLNGINAYIIFNKDKKGSRVYETIERKNTLHAHLHVLIPRDSIIMIG